MVRYCDSCDVSIIDNKTSSIQSEVILGQVVGWHWINQSLNWSEHGGKNVFYNPICVGDDDDKFIRWFNKQQHSFMRSLGMYVSKKDSTRVWNNLGEHIGKHHKSGEV